MVVWENNHIEEWRMTELTWQVLRGLEGIRPALAVDGDKVGYLQFDGLQEPNSTWSTHHYGVHEELAFAIRDVGLAVAYFEVEVKGAALGYGALWYGQAHASVSWLQDPTIVVKHSIGAGDDRTVAVGIKWQLAVHAIVVVVSRVGRDAVLDSVVWVPGRSKTKIKDISTFFRVLKWL